MQSERQLGELKRLLSCVSMQSTLLKYDIPGSPSL